MCSCQGALAALLPRILCRTLKTIQANEKQLILFEHLSALFFTLGFPSAIDLWMKLPLSIQLTP